MIDTSSFGKSFQKRIPHLKMGGVRNKLLEVLTIDLRDHAVYKSSSHLSPIPDQLDVIRCDHHRWIFPDMLRKACVVVPVFLNSFFLANLERAKHLPLVNESPFYRKK